VRCRGLAGTTRYWSGGRPHHGGEDGDGVRYAEGQVEVVLDEEDGDAVARDGTDDLAHEVHNGRCESFRRLVEQQDRRAGDQGTGHG
jgi:hypothetical protein